MIEQSQGSYRRPLVAAFVFVAAVHVIIAAGVLMSGCRQEKMEFEDLDPKDAPPAIDNEWSEDVDDIPSAPVEGGSERSPFADAPTVATEQPVTREVLPPAPGATTGPRFSSQNDRARSGGAMVEVTPRQPVGTTAATPDPGPVSTAASTPEAAAPPAAAPSRQTYRIQSGDSFYKIASKFNVNFKDIERANPNVNPRRLQIGQEIVIPGTTSTAVSAPATGTQPVSAPAGGRIHKVRSGDNLSSLAVRYKTTVNRIMSANNMRSTRINVGQELVIPAP